MAGYFIYSVGWDEFQQFIDSPTDEQFTTFVEAIDDYFEEYLADCHEEGDAMPLAESWSSDGEDPEAAIRSHLKEADWYVGLDHHSQLVWSRSIERVCEDLSYRCDSDGIYWNLIELATKQLGGESDEYAVARFGRCPYGVEAIEAYEPKNFGTAWWDPYHSMHRPDEVKRLINELDSLSEVVMASGDSQAIADFEELMPALNSIANDGRMLWVAVDT